MISIILGIDPGSRVTGYGLIKKQKNKFAYLASGCIRIHEQDLAGKLAQIFDGVSEIIRMYTPTEFAIEQVFMAKNPDSALKLGQARGAAIVAATQAGLPVSEYSARQIKQSVVGIGNAEKHQVQNMVMTLLDLSQKPQMDAADALAVALCHQQTQQHLIKFAGQAKKSVRRRLR